MNRIRFARPDRATVIALAGALGVYLAVYAVVAGLDLDRVLEWDYTAFVEYGLDHDNDGLVDERDAALLDPIWVSLGRFLLSWGFLPFFVVAVAGIALRIRAWRKKRPSSFATWPRFQRGIVYVLLLATVGVAAVPLAMTLTIWTTVEAAWWVQWYGNRQALEGITLLVGPIIYWFGLVAAAAGLLRLALPPAKRIGWLRRIAWAVPVVPAVVVLGVALVVAFVRIPRVASLPGHAEFAEHCDGCHHLILPMAYVKLPVEWDRTLETHETEDGVPLEDDQRAAIKDFLVGMRSFPASWTFRTRCGRCHGSDWEDWVPRPREEWALTVDRIARWSPYFYRQPVRDEIVSHLVATKSGDTVPTEAERQVRSVCGRCHSVSFEAERWMTASEPAILDMVVRMNDKLSEPLAEADLPALAKLWRALIGDPDRMRRVVPHDRPLDDEEWFLPWVLQ